MYEEIVSVNEDVVETSDLLGIIVLYHLIYHLGWFKV